MPSDHHIPYPAGSEPDEANSLTAATPAANGRPPAADRFAWMAVGDQDPTTEDADPFELDAEERYAGLIRDRTGRRGGRRRADTKAKVVRDRTMALLAEAEDSLATGFQMTYRPGRSEGEWLLEALGTFFAQGVVSDVLRLVKGGKEASVYQCTPRAALDLPYVAAKVYRPGRFRGLSNDALYREGRRSLDGDGKLMKDSRAIHAMAKGTTRGRQLRHSSWLAHELTTLQVLYDAGADVPRPVASGDHAVLMAFVGDDRRAAATLNGVRLRRGEAQPLFDRVVRNMDLMLARNMVHGDLSAFNILYWQGTITLIDFPQVVNPYENPAARRIFDRDVARVCEYFIIQGLHALDPTTLAGELWARHLPEDLWPALPGGVQEPDLDAAGEDMGSYGH